MVSVLLRVPDLPMILKALHRDTLTKAKPGHEVCYKHYGCFSDAPPFDFNLVQLPEDPETIDTKFYLFTRQNGVNNEHRISDIDGSYLNRTYFYPERKTTIIIHGYIESIAKPWVNEMTEALLKREDRNVIVVDWKRGARFPYHQVVGNARLVGAQLTSLLSTIRKYTNQKFSYADVHCIGFSTGSHICGYAGRDLNKNQSTPLERISSLDPAAPYYEFRHIDVRLDPTDATFVDVIHTDTKTLLIKGFGTAQAIGHLDFYPNGGYSQPNCRTRDNGVAQYFTCSHERAIAYFIESIGNANCPFRSYRCKNYADFEKGLCRSCPLKECPSMGYESVNYKDIDNGTFYLQTSGKKPFCAYHYNIAITTQSKLFADLNGEVYVTISGDKDITETITIPKFYYKSGSTNYFLIHTRMDIGKLEKVQIQHGAWVDYWGLDNVVIKPMWVDTKYTGCFKRWLNSNDNEVKLHENHSGCT